jgi:outer membrane protein OmpA-like peptidoglycan-associated protein
VTSMRDRGVYRRTDSRTRSSAASAGVLQRKCACGQHTSGGQQCEECKKKGMTLQRQSNGSAMSNTVPPVVQDVLNSPGRPLDPGTRAFMEPRFGQDFSQVRVHTDAKAADSADAVNAHAYTVGSDIVFGPGQYSTHPSSRHLLAHELTHVVQQASSGVGANSEASANAAADRVTGGQPIHAAAIGGAPVSLQKSGKDDTATGGGVGVVGGSTEPPVDEFAFDKSDIPPQHLQYLAALKARLIAAPNATVNLTGHTDTVGTEKYNESLGRRRAQAVKDFLTKDKAVALGRVSIQSEGELAPATGQPPAKLDPKPGEKNPKNRRVEIKVVGIPPTDKKTDPPSDRPTVVIPPPSGHGKPTIPFGRDTIKDICVVYPDLCDTSERPGPPPDFWKPIPPAPRHTQKSPLDVINETIVDPIVKTVTKGLPKAARDKILELAHDGVEKGITGAAAAAAAAAGLDAQAQQAISKAVEAGIKYKGQQPGQGGGNQ